MTTFILAVGIGIVSVIGRWLLSTLPEVAPIKPTSDQLCNELVVAIFASSVILDTCWSKVELDKWLAIAASIEAEFKSREIVKMRVLHDRIHRAHPRTLVGARCVRATGTFEQAYERVRERLRYLGRTTNPNVNPHQIAETIRGLCVIVP